MSLHRRKGTSITNSTPMGKSSSKSQRGSIQGLLITSIVLLDEGSSLSSFSTSEYVVFRCVLMVVMATMSQCNFTCHASQVTTRNSGFSAPKACHGSSYSHSSLLLSRSLFQGRWLSDMKSNAYQASPLVSRAGRVDSMSLMVLPVTKYSSGYLQPRTSLLMRI
jgi:hypothetical protein